MSSLRIPALFIGHGSPLNAIEDNPFSQAWQQIAGSFDKPEAIICISAHWESRETMVTADLHPHTIHDFGVFQGNYTTSNIQLPAILVWRSVLPE